MITFLMSFTFIVVINIQLNLSYVTFQGNIEIWSLNTGLVDMKCIVKVNKNLGHIIKVIA